MVRRLKNIRGGPDQALGLRIQEWMTGAEPFRSILAGPALHSHLGKRICGQRLTTGAAYRGDAVGLPTEEARESHTWGN